MRTAYRLTQTLSDISFNLPRKRVRNEEREYKWRTADFADYKPFEKIVPESFFGLKSKVKNKQPEDHLANDNPNDNWKAFSRSFGRYRMVWEGIWKGLREDWKVSERFEMLWKESDLALETLEALGSSKCSDFFIFANHWSIWHRLTQTVKRVRWWFHSMNCAW